MGEIYQLLIICPLIFIASIIDAIAGSGSIISFPAYLVAGLPAHYALGTHKFVAFWGVLVSALRYIKNKKYELKLIITFSVLCMLGTYIGSKLILSINDIYLRYALIFLISIFFIFSVLKKYKKSKEQNITQEKIIKILSQRKKRVLSLIIGFVIGLYGGTIGIGTTSILILIFIKIFNIDQVKATGNARIIYGIDNRDYILRIKIIFIKQEKRLAPQFL